MSKRASVDRWLERFFRRRAAMANGASTMGSQLDRLQRMSCDSDGKAFPARNDAAIPCSDDSAAFNAAHDTTNRLADHAADLMVWSSLTNEERHILEEQRRPLMCPGWTERAKRDDLGVRCICQVCGVRFDIHIMQRRIDDPAPEYVPQHLRTVAIECERRIEQYRPGEGIELGERVKHPITGEVTDFWKMTVREPVMRRNDQIAEELDLSESQVHTRIKSARRKIRERIVDDGDGE